MDWPVVKLADLCDILDNLRKPITKKDRVEGPYPYYGATGILSYVDDYIFDEKLVLVGEDGAKWGAGENSAFKIDGKAWVNNHAHVVRPLREKLLDQWLIYYLNGQDLSDFITGMTVPKLNQGKLKEIPIPLPSLYEQKRIVAILDQAFADLEQVRAKTEQNLKNARELFDSYLQQVFSQRGEGWRETTLGSVAKFKNGLNFSQSSKGEELTIVGVKDFKSHFMVPFEQLDTIKIDGDLSEEYELKKNDIITVRSNGNKRLIGRCLLMGTPISKTSYSGFTIRIRLIEDNICPKFLTYYMKSPSTHELLINSGEGANISNLNQKILTALPVTYPSYEQQCELVKNIKTIETESNSLMRIYTEKLDSIDELKKSILQKAFSCELTTTA